jgi:hypothetical protein
VERKQTPKTVVALLLAEIDMHSNKHPLRFDRRNFLIRCLHLLSFFPQPVPIFSGVGASAV